MGSQKFHLIAQFRAYFVIYTPKLGFSEKPQNSWPWVFKKSVRYLDFNLVTDELKSKSSNFTVLQKTITSWLHKNVFDVTCLRLLKLTPGILFI